MVTVWQPGAPHAHFPSLARDIDAHAVDFEILVLRPTVDGATDDVESAASVPLSRWASIRQSFVSAVTH